MINEKQLLQAAESAAAGAILEWLEARRQVPGEILSQRGLLAATRDALVFVVDDLLRAGPTTVWRRRDLHGYQLQSELFAATLKLQVGESDVHFTDLRPEQAAVLLATCGLTSPTAAPVPREAEPHLPPPTSSAAPPFSKASPLETQAPTASPLTAMTFATAVIPQDRDRDRDRDRKEAVGKDSDLNVYVPIPSPVKAPDADAEDADADADDDEDDEDEDGEDEDDEIEDSDDADSDDADAASGSKSTRNASDSKDPAESVQALFSKIDAASKSESRSSQEAPAVASPSKPTPTPNSEAVSGSLVLGMLIVLIAAIALPVLVGGDLRQSLWGLRPNLILGAIGSAKETLTIGFYLAVAVTVIGAPSSALGSRPTVFWTTLPMFFALVSLVTGTQSVFPDPKHQVSSTATATELLLRLRNAQSMPQLVVLLGAYLYGLPLLGVWFRALATHPRHRKEDRLSSVVETGNSQTPLLMLGSAMLIPFASCLYVERSGHAPWAILIALAFIAPSALLVWQGSRLDSRLRWELGGSPAAFAIQGAFAYLLYWLMVRQQGIIPHIDAALEQSERTLVQGSALETLQRVLGHGDVALLKGLALSQLGVVIAAMIGHGAIVKVDQSQKCSVSGWLLAIALLLIVVLMAWATDMDFPVRVPAFIEQVREAALHSTSSG